MRFLGAKYAKMSLWPGFHPDPAGWVSLYILYSAGFTGRTYKGRGSRGEGRRCERKGWGEGEGEERKGRKGERGREGVISALLFPTSSPGLE